MKLRMENHEKRNFVLTGNLYKVLIVLALPIMFNNLMQTLYNLVDTFWVGQISNSDIEVTAVSVVWPIPALILALGFGLYIAGTSMMSQHIGANERDKANYIASQMFGFAFILGIIMSLVGFIASPYILKLMGVEPDVYKLSLSYLQIIFIETPIVFCLLIFTASRQANGDTLSPVLFTVTSVILNMILDPVFILVFDLGVAGVAWATVLSKVIVTPFWLYMAFFDKRHIHMTLEKMKLNIITLWKIIAVAIPASFGQAMNMAGFVVLNFFIVSYGSPTMAAFGVGNRINSIIMMPAMGIGSALAFVVGQNIGNQNYARAKKAFKTSLIMTLVIMLLGMAIILPEPVRRFLIGFFLDEPYTVALALEYMVFVGFNMPLMGIFQNYAGVFQGSGKTLYQMLMSIIRLWGIRIPLIWIFNKFPDYFPHHFPDLGSDGIWYAMVISNIIVCLLGTFLYVFGKWERKIV